MSVEKNNILNGDRQQFLQLLRPFFLEAQAEFKQDVSDQQRLQIATALWTEKKLPVAFSADGLKQLLQATDAMVGASTDAFRAELNFHFRVLDGYIRFSHLDKKLMALLAQSRLVLLAHAIADQNFWFAEHPLRQLVDLLYQGTVGWQDDLGKNGDTIAEIVETAVTRINQAGLQDLDYFSQLHDETEQAFLKITQRLDKLQQRLSDSETGVLKASIANFTVIDFLNHVCKGKRLPVGVSSTLQKTFANEMKLLIIQQGLDSPLWLRAQKLVELLVNSYQSAPSSDTERSILMQLPDELEHWVKEALPVGQDFENFLNVIAFDFTQIAGGKALDFLEAVPHIDMPDQLEGVETTVSQNLVVKARKYKEGQWFLYKHGETLKRCKLLLALPDYDQLLFSSFVGQKVFTTTYENFAYLLSSRLMQPLYQKRITQRAVELTLDKLLESYASREQARVNAQQQAELKAAAEREEQARFAAAEKARLEAERIAQERADRQVQETLAQIADDMKRQVKLALDSLSLGSWVEWQAEGQENFRRIKLAVKFNATGRFVFVDEDGATVLEQHKDDLVDLVMLKKMKLLESDQKFAERLAKVVNNIRTGEA